MPTDFNQLIQRLNHRVRVKIAYPNVPVKPFIEYDAILIRIDTLNEFAYFNIGLTTLKVAWNDVEKLEGGLGPPLDAGPSRGTAW